MAGRLVRTIGIFEQFRGAKNRELEQTLEQHNKVQKQLYVAPSCQSSLLRTHLADKGRGLRRYRENLAAHWSQTPPDSPPGDAPSAPSSPRSPRSPAAERPSTAPASTGGKRGESVRWSPAATIAE